MASLGSGLKKREMLSARLGDVLSHLYLASMLIKQWHESESVEHEAALMHYSCRTLLYRAEQAFTELFDNLPNRALAMTLSAVALPLGRRWHKPQDRFTRDIARAISTDSALRHKLTADTWNTQEAGQRDNPLARYNTLLADSERAEPLYRRIAKAYSQGELPAEALHPEQRVEAAWEAGLIEEDDAIFMRRFEREVLDMLSVDDFAFDAFATDKDRVVWHDAT